jgi:hypothetical protein
VQDGADAVVKCIVEAVEELGFRSWAYRIINTAGDADSHPDQVIAEAC